MEEIFPFYIKRNVLPLKITNERCGRWLQIKTGDISHFTKIVKISGEPATRGLFLGGDPYVFTECPYFSSSAVIKVKLITVSLALKRYVIICFISVPVKQVSYKEFGEIQHIKRYNKKFKLLF